jgi:signal transduction histidine kinase
LKRIAAGQSGVGVAGMRERVKQLGGTFQIRSNGPGTTLDVELPLTE